MEVKQLWKTIGRWSTEKKVEASKVANNQTSHNSKQISSAQSEGLKAEGGELKPEHPRSHREVSSKNLPLEPDSIIETDSGFEKFLKTFKMMGTEKSLTDREINTFKSLQGEEKSEIQSVVVRRWDLNANSKAKEQLKKSILEYLSAARQDLLTLRREFVQEKAKFMNSVYELILISSILLGGKPKQDLFEESEQEYISQKVMPLEPSVSTSQPTNNWSNNRRSQCAVQTNPSNSKFDENGGRQLNCEKQWSRTSAQFCTSVNQRYEKLLVHSERLYTTIINENTRTIEAVKKKLESKNEELVSAHQQMVVLDASSKRINNQYLQSEQERKALQESERKLLIEIGELRQMLNQSYQQSYNLYQQNSCLMAENKQLTEQLMSLKESLTVVLNPKLVELQCSNSLLTNALEERDEIVEQLSRKIVQIQSAFTEVALKQNREVKQSSSFCETAASRGESRIRINPVPNLQGLSLLDTNVKRFADAPGSDEYQIFGDNRHALTSRTPTFTLNSGQHQKLNLACGSKKQEISRLSGVFSKPSTERATNYSISQKTSSGQRVTSSLSDQVNSLSRLMREQLKKPINFR